VAGEDGSPSTDKYYDRCRARTQKALEANDRLLDQGNEFLFDLVDNISETSANESPAKIDAWVETIREQNQIFLKGEYFSEARN
jgi:DNA-binding MurR/RpiR family transcriptional regulator